jgi:thiamine-phosphate pyrophosphorylase
VSELGRLYLVAPARIKAGSLATLIPELAAAGVEIVQLREKDREAGDILRLAAPLREACGDAGIPFIVNDRPDIALALDAGGVHLGQNDLGPEIARRILGSKAIIGRSTHSPEEIDAEVSGPDRPDYIGVGPVHTTPTKPGRPGTGLELVRYATHVSPVPWFVTGGMNARTLPEAMEAGARRAVVVRGITEATDPVRAAAEIRSVLDSQPV